MKVKPNWRGDNIAQPLLKSEAQMIDNMDMLHPVTGVALICIGASVQMGLSDVLIVLNETSSGTPLVLTIVGMIIFFLSGFGAVAALKENLFLLKTFSGMMLMLFIIEIIVGISAYSYRDKLQRVLSRNFLILLNQYGSDKEITKGLDLLHQKFQCCGAQNFTDWFNSTFGKSTSSVPMSCCKNIQQKCGDHPLENSENIYKEGCVEKMRNWIGDHIGVIGAVGVGFGVAQICGILFSWWLVKILQEDYVTL
ncbi:CD63 antigen-like [Bombina bombina]|uniref:CD63 antigen-like n=1 Tax=Bombina bombina TaxID=8345 RepID=UPI00235A506B|nr:CD63 antigen-like [Bombina bombina]